MVPVLPKKSFKKNHKKICELPFHLIRQWRDPNWMPLMPTIHYHIIFRNATYHFRRKEERNQYSVIVVLVQNYYLTFLENELVIYLPFSKYFQAKYYMLNMFTNLSTFCLSIYSPYLCLHVIYSQLFEFIQIRPTSCQSKLLWHIWKKVKKKNWRFYELVRSNDNLPMPILLPNCANNKKKIV